MHKESIMQPICDRELHEECGVFGVVGVPDAANLIPCNIAGRKGAVS